MSKPAIVLIDDDPAVLPAIERDVRQRYGRSYALVSAASGAAGLEYLKQQKKRSGRVALFLVDQRLPQMTGIQFLESARLLFLDAKKYC